MNKVDYVIPYVNCDDQSWIDLYSRTVGAEFPKSRYRDNGTLKYQLRGIEKNMPWINRVYLIVQSKSQIPHWLNVQNPRLRIVTHDEFIPREYLPAFKSSLIELHIHRIDDLSENFILSNDDMVPIKEQNIESYFRRDRPVQVMFENDKMLSPNGDSMAFKLYKMMILEQFFTHNENFKGIKHFHLLLPYKKSFWKEMIDKYKYTFSVSFCENRYRGFMDLNHWLISDLQILSGVSIIDNTLNTEGYIKIDDFTCLEDINSVVKNSDTLCMNDWVENNEKNLDIIETTLSGLLPRKSAFEM